MQQLIPCNCVMCRVCTLYTVYCTLPGVHVVYTYKGIICYEFKKICTYQICQAGLSLTRVVIWCNSVKGGFI